MKKTILLALSILTLQLLQAQYYYNDLVLTAQASEKQRKSAQAKVYSIDFLSFDGQGAAIEGLESKQQYKKDYRESSTQSSFPLGGKTFSRSTFDPQYRLLQQVDSGEDHRNVTSYQYDKDGRLLKLSTINQSEGGFQISEEHVWEYNTKGQPLKMTRIKNAKDSSIINFELDEQGKVVEEKGMRKGQPLPSVYYYYDELGRLTDVVRYNNAAKKLLPDYVFEYDEKGRIGSMIVVPEGSNDYQKWYYSYDEDGLKQLEACYSKSKQLIGKVEYQYKYYE